MLRPSPSFLADGPPLTIVGNSLGGWLAWLVAQEQLAVEELILIAPAFNMMERARSASFRRTACAMAIDRRHALGRRAHASRSRRFPGTGSRTARYSGAGGTAKPRRVKTTILHGLQDTVIRPEGSWDFVTHVLSQDETFPIELLLKTGDHRLSSPEHLDTFRRLVTR